MAFVPLPVSYPQVLLRDNLALVVGGEPQTPSLIAFDVSNPAQTVAVGRFDFPALGFWTSGGSCPMAVTDEYLIVGGGVYGHLRVANPVM